MGTRQQIGDNVPMRLVKWIVFVAVFAVLFLAGVAVALKYWAGSADFRGRIEREATAALGVQVRLAALKVDPWPLPAVAVEGIQVLSQPPLTLERVEARPAWAALVRGRLEIATLIVRKAVLPEQAITALAAGVQKKAGSAGPATEGAAPSWIPRRVVLDDVTWVDARGGQSTIDALASSGDDGLPDKLAVKVLKGRLAGAKLDLQRNGGAWALRADVGGGTVKGQLTLKAGAAGGASVLEGTLETSNVEVGALTAPSRTLTGRLEAQTTLRSEFRDPGALADALQSQTRFTVRGAVVHGIDLAQAVKTVGLNRAGETRLDTLAGQVSTQGRAIQLNNLVASSGALAATGNVGVAPNRSLSGRVTVDLASSAVAGAVGVPLVVGGTLDAPSVSLSRGALVGAAIGTAVAPGLGTGAGAKLGDKIGEGLRGLFGK